MSETQPVVDACKIFWRAWCDRNIDRLRGSWAMDDPACSYLSADAPQRVVGSDAVQAYLAQRLRTLQLIRMAPRTVCPRRLSPNLGAVFAVVDWAHQTHEASVPLGGTLRISAVLRRRDQIWQLCHYAEAPLAPLVELRRFYQQIAADGHEAIP